MLRAYLDAAQAVKPSARCTAFRSVMFSRAVSTNTAIHRGIRKSRFGSTDDRPAYQSSRTPGRARAHGERSRQDELASTRVRRPNHQARQDIEDMEESAWRKEGRLTPRQKNYLKGGRRDTTTTAGSLQGPPDRFSQRSSYRDRSPSIRTERTGRYSDAGQRVNGAYGSDRAKNIGRSLSSRVNKEESFGDGSHQKHRPERLHEEYQKESSTQSFGEGRRNREDTMGDTGDIRPNSFSRPDRARYPEERRRRGAEAPLSIPYTTPASEFLYGSSVVIAALKTARRKLYRMYLYNGENRDVANQDKLIIRLAHSRGLEVTKVQRDWLKLMDKMSGGRPHNVCTDRLCFETQF